MLNPLAHEIADTCVSWKNMLPEVEVLGRISGNILIKVL
jgi:hypothetical protein